MTEPIDYSLNVTRSDALMLYATSQGGYTVRLHLRLDEPIRPDAMRKALDLTAKRNVERLPGSKENAGSPKL